MPVGGGVLGIVRGTRRGVAAASSGLLALHLRVAVDDDVAEVGQQLGGAVAARRELEQLRRLVEERRRRLARAGTSGG